MNTLKSTNLWSYRVTVSNIDEKTVFGPNLALKNQKKGKLFLEYPRDNCQYVVYHSPGEFTQIKISFQPGV